MKEHLKLTEEFLEKGEKYSRSEVFMQIDALKELIRFHRRKYYDEDSPLVSDAQFDRLFNLLKDWEKEFPELLIADSPTQQIHQIVQTELKKVAHLSPMLSLDNAMNTEEILAWEKRIRNILKDNREIIYTIETKFDGLAVSLLYENDELVRGATRGDGEIGEDITLNLKTIIDKLPKISFSKYDFSEIELRGEVIMNKKDFVKLNEERAEKGEKLFSNPRNASAGSVRQLNTAITASRRLSIVFFSMISYVNNKAYYEDNLLEEMHKKGHIPEAFHKKTNSIQEVVKICQEVEKTRENYAYEIDGAVIKVQDPEIRKILGGTAHHPRWAIAFKFQAKEETTILEKVEWQVGRTGVLTPVAHLKPVYIDGVRVARATLHNTDEVARKGVLIGDTITVIRAGEVIPRVVAPITEARDGSEKEIIPPKNCPSCGKPVFQEKDEVALKCNNLECPAQVAEKLIHFCSRQGLDIEHLGDKVCRQLIEKGLVKNFADIFYLQEDDFLQLDLFKEKSSQNAVLAIENAKKQPAWRFISALGIPLVGKRTARSLAENFSSFAEITSASLEELVAIYDVGEKMAESIYEFFRNERNLRMFESFEEAGISMEFGLEEKKEQIFAGKTFVFTGSLQKMKREEAQNLVESLGGKASGSVSKNTDFLVYGEKAGSKKRKAEELGVEVISEEEFGDMVK